MCLLLVIWKHKHSAPGLDMQQVKTLSQRTGPSRSTGGSRVRGKCSLAQSMLLRHASNGSTVRCLVHGAPHVCWSLIAKRANASALVVITSTGCD